MPELEIIIQHDWKDMDSKGISSEILLATLNLVKDAVSAIQTEHIEDLRRTIPDAFHQELENIDSDNPAYRIVFLSVEQGSVKAKSTVASVLLTLLGATGGQLASDVIKDTEPYQTAKQQIVEKVDSVWNDFLAKMEERTSSLNKDESSKFNYSFYKEGEKVVLSVSAKKIITDEPKVQGILGPMAGPGRADGKSTDEQIIAQICKEMIDQENQGAAAAQYFERLLADELCFRRANGQTVRKPDFIRGLPASSHNVRRTLDGSVDVHVHGAVAVASLRVAVSPAAGVTPRLYRNIRIFWREPPGSQWRLHMWFNAEIPPAS
jgi:hypothetical protein